MIPTGIAKAMARQRGDVVRANAAEALTQLSGLGVKPESQLGAFFLRYQVSPVVSETSHEELMDVASPGPQLGDATAFVQEVYGVPEQFLCLSSAEGEGFYLYERLSEAVYDAGVRDVALLASGQLQPRWADFFSFLAWYLA